MSVTEQVQVAIEKLAVAAELAEADPLTFDDLVEEDEYTIEDRLHGEQYDLFHHLWCHLVKQDEELGDDFNIARNLACSEWSIVHGRMTPTRMLPKQMDLLRKNYEMVRAEISRRKYYLVKAFKPILEEFGRSINGDQLACFEYWEEELAKDSPDLS